MPASAPADASVSLFPLGDFELQSGEVITDAHIAYRTFGKNDGRPAIVYPTWYSGTITAGNEWLISTPEHPRRGLDPEKYFIICPALFGNGESSSPSNTPSPQNGPNFPKTTFYDNVRAQHRLVTSHFGLKKLKAVVGWSMGGGQTFQWISQYPDLVEFAVPFCGSARTSEHNWVFLEGVKKSITSNPSWQSGNYTTPPVEALKALGRVYAGWGFSQTFYREKGFERNYGIKGGLEDVMVKFWEAWATSKDANNMLHMLWTWQHGDIGAQPLYAGASKRDVRASDGGRQGTRGNGGAVTDEDEEAFKRALKGIRAKTVVLPCRTDLYFPPEDSEIEVANMGANAELKVIESIWGHWAGGPGDSKEDAAFIDKVIADLLGQSSSL